MQRVTDTSNARLAEKRQVYGPLGTREVWQPTLQVSALLVSVKSGAVDIFYGGGGDGRLVPDLHFGQTNRPVWVPYTGGAGDFELVAADPVNLTKAMVHFLG